MTFSPERRGTSPFDVFNNLSRDEAIALVKKYGSDSLTGLLTKDAFVDLALGYDPKKGPYELLAMDMIGFKRYNLISREVGDFALALVGQAISSSTRSGDLTGRIGGDEFGIMSTPNLSPIFVERLNSSLANINKIFDCNLHGIPLDYRFSTHPIPNLTKEHINLAINNAIDDSYQAIAPSKRV